MIKKPKVRKTKVPQFPTPWRVVREPYAGHTQKRGELCLIKAANGKVIYHGPSSFQALENGTADLIVAAINHYAAHCAEIQMRISAFDGRRS